MNAIDAIKGSLGMAEMLGMLYISDLDDSELMQRPHPKCQHINWQIGHLILSEHQMVQPVVGDAMPDLPEGFAQQYSKETIGSDSQQDFATKDALLAAYKEQRAATLAALDASSEADLEKPTGIEYAPTRGSVFSLLSSHWLMHCGQWVIVRRNNDKPIVM